MSAWASARRCSKYNAVPRATYASTSPGSERDADVEGKQVLRAFGAQDDMRGGCPSKEKGEEGGDSWNHPPLLPSLLLHGPPHRHPERARERARSEGPAEPAAGERGLFARSLRPPPCGTLSAP